jgi:NitT/TauT family transport system substrate-binding protein
MHKLGTLIGACALLLAATAASAQHKVTLAHALPQLTPSFAIDSSMPVYLGYWKQEGLDVEVITTAGAAAAMQLVIGGKADAAIGSPHTAMLAIQKAAPVKIYYTTLRGDIFGIAVPEGSDIRTLDQLRGKTVGVSSFASAGTNYAKGLLKTVGLSDNDYSVVEIGVGARAAAALRTNQVQALGLWDEAYVQMEENGVKIGRITKDSRAAFGMSGSLVVLADAIKDRRQVLIGLARGIAKAQLFQEINPEASVRIHWAVYPQSAPRAGVTDAEVKKAARVVEVRRAIQSRDIYGTGDYGDTSIANMDKFQTYLVETAQLPKAIDVRDYFTNDLIKEINQFDAAAIVRQAKELKGP